MRKFIKLIVVILLVFLICGVNIYQSYHVLDVTYVKFASHQLYHDMRVVFVSDMHDHTFGEENCDLVETIEDKDPDLIILGGDMLNEDSENADIVTRLIRELVKIAPVYYGLGNHELAYMQKDALLIEKLEAAGAIVLDQQYRDVVICGNLVRIGGLYDYAFSRENEITTRDTMESDTYDFLTAFCSGDVFKIMISHRPDTFIFGDAHEIWDIDYVLSGHDHGGQVILPFFGGLWAPDQGFFPSYVQGEYEFSSMTMFITRGLGSNRQILPRFNNLPEIVCLTFTAE